MLKLSKMAASALCAVMTVGCGAKDGGAGSGVSVGGTYSTVVTLLENSCGQVTIEQHETVVSQAPSDTSITVTHAGNSYSGKVRVDGSFSTMTKTISDPGGNVGITIGGTFSKTAIDATVTVTIARATPCQYTVHWLGPKQGAPNTLP